MQNGTSLSKTKDIHLRVAVRARLQKEYADATDTMIIEELGLSHGWARVDLAVINGLLHGFELKSDRDTLSRLPGQVDTYSAVLDRVTIVVGRQHLISVLDLVPEWWGIDVAKFQPDGTVKLSEIREPEDNPKPDLLATAKLLWREEALILLEQAGAANGYRSKARIQLYERLVQVAEPGWFKAAVYKQLRSRSNWRSDAQ